METKRADYSNSSVKMRTLPEPLVHVHLSALFPDKRRAHGRRAPDEERTMPNETIFESYPSCRSKHLARFRNEPVHSRRNSTSY